MALISIRNIGGGQSVGKRYLYDNGVWNVGCSNPGSFIVNGATFDGWVLGSDKLSKTSASAKSLIVTTSKVDLTNYSTLHVKAKALTNYGGSGARFTVCSGTDVLATSLADAFITTLNDVVDYALDVSALTEGYISVFSTDARNAEIYEIYLTK